MVSYKVSLVISILVLILAIMFVSCAPGNSTGETCGTTKTGRRGPCYHSGKTCRETRRCYTGCRCHRPCH